MDESRHIGDGRVTALLSDPEHWTQGTFANDDFNVATCFCLVGAIAKCYDGSLVNLFKIDVYHKASHAIKRKGWLTLSNFNDCSDHRTVLNFCKEYNL